MSDIVTKKYGITRVHYVDCAQGDPAFCPRCSYIVEDDFSSKSVTKYGACSDCVSAFPLHFKAGKPLDETAYAEWILSRSVVAN